MNNRYGNNPYAQKPSNALGSRPAQPSGQPQSHSVSKRQAPLSAEQKRATGAQPTRPSTPAKPSSARPSSTSGLRTAPEIPAPGKQLTTQELRNAIFWSEILAQPKYAASRERRRAMAQLMAQREESEAAQREEPDATPVSDNDGEGQEPFGE